jgi:hypothetical protein
MRTGQNPTMGGKTKQTAVANALLFDDLYPTVSTAYVYTVAITNNRIEKLESGQVSFRFKNSDTDQWETKSLPALDFMHRFLQHMLPEGFVKIRYYGFMAANKRNLIAVANYLPANTALSENVPAKKPTIAPAHIAAQN